MKKLLTALIVFVILGTPVFAESQPLLPASFVEIDNSNLTENTLLASDDGKVFIEFSKDSKFINAEEKINFSGEILPPHVIELDVPKPRGLMQELTTFEMVSNSGADILFLDKYDKISRKNIFREKLLNPDGLNRSAWVKLVYLIDNPLVKLPKLWEWQGEEKGWFKIGGNITEVAGDGKSRILSAILRRTGIYSIFDENPSPQHFADEYEVYPKREYTGKYLDEIEPENNPTDISFPQNIGNQNENIAGFHSSGEPPALDYATDKEIPSTNISANSQILQDLQNKIDANPAKIAAEPEIAQKIDNLKKLINKKIETETETARLTNELNTVSFALSRAETEEEKTNLDKTFLGLQNDLKKIEAEAPDEEKFLTLKKEVDNFFAGITLSQGLQTNIVEKEIDKSPPKINNNEEGLYIPENATLVKSGGEERQNISWKFPVFLLVCFGLLGWGVSSTRKKSI